MDLASDTDRLWPAIVVGGGPAGLATSHELKARGIDHLVLERGGRPGAVGDRDLLPGPDGHPCLLELELTEPSLFFDQAPGSASRLAALLAAWAADPTVRARMDRV